MRMPRCLVIGANGLVGRRLGKLLDSEGAEWAGTCNKRDCAGLERLDITDIAGLQRVFSGYGPKKVFLCANLAGGVDLCEREPLAAGGFYLDATVETGKLCRKHGAQLIFISTDYVFDGTAGPYKEEDKKNPLNVYGRLKLAAEDWIRQNLPGHIVVRTTNVFGWDPETVTPNYIMNMYRTLKSGKDFNAPSFLWGNPTYVGDLASALIELAGSGASGVFHVVGSSFVDRYDWAVRACGILGLDKERIRELKAPLSPMTVPRPLKSNLDTGKFRKDFRTVLHDLDSGLRMMRDDMGNA